MNDDPGLLRRYVDEGSDAAFAEFVQRNLPLVYGAALRRTDGDAEIAADVAQEVFAAAARQARNLARKPALPAWLHAATRNAAANQVVASQRGKTREPAPVVLVGAQDPAAAAAEWDKLRPVLDAAIDELPTEDRAAVVMRHLQQRSLSQIGATLKVSEDAARMRTEGALDRLRAVLERRGITATAAALSTIISGYALVAVPGQLATRATAHALAARAAGSAPSVAGGLPVSAKGIALACVAAVLAFVGGALVGRMRPPPAQRPVVVTDTRAIDALRKENANLKAALDRAHAENRRVADQAASTATATVAASAPASAAEPAATATPTSEPSVTPSPTGNIVTSPPQQRAIMNNLRQIASARDQYLLEHGRAPGSLQDLVGEDKYIRRLVPVNGEDYTYVPLGQGQPLSVVAEDGTNVVYDPNPRGKSTTSSPASDIGSVARALGIEAAAFQHAWDAYAAAHANAKPPSLEALAPYFATPQQGADFLEALDRRKTTQK